MIISKKDAYGLNLLFHNFLLEKREEIGYSENGNMAA